MRLGVQVAGILKDKEMSENVLELMTKYNREALPLAKKFIENGADKISLNTGAVKNKKLISKASMKFGNQAIVVSIDVKKMSKTKWEVLIEKGRERTGIDVVEWVNTVKEHGAGEILLTSMDRDGTKEGFDNKLTKAVSSSVSIPVIASGGAGTLQHLVDGIKEGGAEAVLAASIFHYSEYTVQEAKKAMSESGLEIRI